MSLHTRHKILVWTFTMFTSTTFWRPLTTEVNQTERNFHQVMTFPFLGVAGVSFPRVSNLHLCTSVWYSSNWIGTACRPKTEDRKYEWRLWLWTWVANDTHPAARFVDQRLKIERRGGDQRRDSLGIWKGFTKNVKSYQNCIVQIMIPITHPAARFVD